MSTTTAEPAAEGAVTRRPIVLIGLMLAMFLSAIEGTIVATAMPSIAARLGGVSLYGWVFSAYLLMQAGTTPLFGKLSDLFGRKPVFMVGLILFLAGSLLCGFASSMEMLVGFRLLQGVGAGAVQPLTIILVGDLYSLVERPRVQGYMASIWGISSIVGPLAGAFIVQQLHWAWIFWMNVPIGILAMAFIWFFLHERIEHRSPSIDYAGAGLLLVGLSSLLVALTQGVEWGWGAVLPLLALFAVCFFAFIRQERRAADPMIHLDLWDDRLIAVANAATLTMGLAMIGLISFVPAYVQAVLGRSALVAGLTLAGMTLGWPIASVIGGRLLVRVGARPLVRTGGLAVAAGALMVALFADAGPRVLGPATFTMGAGFGLLGTTFIVAIQTSVGWARRGVATASNLLMRMIGNAAGAAVFGGILNFWMLRYIDRNAPNSGLSLDSVQGLLDERFAAAGPSSPELTGVLRAGLSESLHLVFWGVFLASLATLWASWGVPDLHPKHTADETPVA